MQSPFDKSLIVRLWYVVTEMVGSHGSRRTEVLYVDEVLPHLRQKTVRSHLHISWGL